MLPSKVVWSLGAGLEDRAVVLTGAAGGIGRACLAAFAAAGSWVIACDLNGEDLEAALTDIPEGRVVPVVADLSTREGVSLVVQSATANLGRLDVLINAAAIHLRRPLGSLTMDDWDRYTDNNVKAVFFLCTAAADVMRPRRWGRIINFTSVAAYTGGVQPETQVAYASTKGAVLTMTRSLARILAPDNVLVNAISPGAVSTPMAGSLPTCDLQAYARAIPLGRLAEPDEIAPAALFLASDHASYMTGAVLDVNGGLHLH